MTRASRLVWVVIASLWVSLSPAAEAQASAPVRIFNTHGSADESQWSIVSGTPPGLSPKNIVLDNGLVRIAHPPTGSTERAGHLLYVKIAGQYRIANDSVFGDWTYTGSSFTDPVSNFAILQNTPQVARIRLSFDFHRHEFQNNASFPVQKTIVLHQATWGYRAILSVPSDLPGEREVGFGGTSTHLLSYTHSHGILWNPYQPPDPVTTDGTDYVWLRNSGQLKKDWWAVSLPFDNSFYRLVALRVSNPAGLRTGQFSGGNTGHLIHWAYDGFSDYEAFVAAVPYDASMAARVTVQNGTATVHVPRPGTYNLMTRAESGRRHTYVTAKAGLTLIRGYNKVDVRGISLYAPIIVPITNGLNLPSDIARPYQLGLRD